MSMDRRIFLRNTVLASPAILAPYRAFSNIWNMQKLQQIGVQVYTVRNELDKDFAGTISKVSDIGYDYLELFNYKEGKIYDIPVKEINTILTTNNIKAVSLHVGTGANSPDQDATMVKNWEKVVADAAEMGLEYLVCAYLADNERQSIDDYKKIADLFNKSGEVCKQYGIQFGYHNHAFEFETMDNEIPYDMLLANTDDELVKMELDLYWIVKAGHDPVKYFKTYPGRFPLWHVKDISNNDEQYYTEVGNGSINWQSIFRHTKLSGMKRFFVEQDKCRDNSPLESLTISYQYLHQLKF
jgi:sugar phosphate isomerase/epimerase